MTLPTFLGIGVPRGGTTWLHELLAAHPAVYVPAKLKEVRFFDRYYGKGLEWYQEFFPPAEQASCYQAIGEVTPGYLSCEQCPERIAQVDSIVKFIAILRNPIDRAHSHYLFRVRLDNYTGTFEEFLSEYSGAIKWGLYSQGIKRYLRYFGREQILILIHEHAFADVSETISTLARFLGVDPGLFPAGAGQTQVNRSYVPRFRHAYTLATLANTHLRQKEYYWLMNLAKRLGVKRMFGQIDAPAQRVMREDTRQYLRNLFSGDRADLEMLLQVDLSHWQ